MAIVFAIRVEGEGYDLPDLSLPWGQDAVIEAVAAANPNTDRGARDRQPGRDAVARQGQRDRRGLVPGPGRRPGHRRGAHRRGEPVGRLPITFPADLAQTPRPELPGLGTPWGTPTTIRLRRGRRGRLPLVRAARATKPLYAFGHGLGYTTFDYSELEVSGGETITATFTVTNTGERDGADVPQLYLTAAAGDSACGCSASSAWSWAPASRAA